MIQTTAEGFSVQGAMTFSNVMRLLGPGRQAIEGGAGRIDLSGVKEADSAALALLLDWLRTARRQDVALRIDHMPENLRSLAALYGVLPLFVEPSRGDPS